MMFWRAARAVPERSLPPVAVSGGKTAIHRGCAAHQQIGDSQLSISLVLGQTAALLQGSNQPNHAL